MPCLAGFPLVAAVSLPRATLQLPLSPSRALMEAVASYGYTAVRETITNLGSRALFPLPPDLVTFLFLIFFLVRRTQTARPFRVFWLDRFVRCARKKKN